MSITQALMKTIQSVRRVHSVLASRQAYDDEQIQVSIITVWTFPRRFKTWSRQASKQSAAFLTMTVSKAG